MENTQIEGWIYNTWFYDKINQWITTGHNIATTEYSATADSQGDSVLKVNEMIKEHIQNQKS